MNRRTFLPFVRCGLLALALIPLAHAAAPGALVDGLQGKSVADRPLDQGVFADGGWKITSASCQLRYDLGAGYRRGTVEFEMKGDLGPEKYQTILGVWNIDALATKAPAVQHAMFQLRRSDEGILMRIVNRIPPKKSMDKHSGVIDWPAKDKWIHVKATWDTQGGTNIFYIDGVERHKGVFRGTAPGFRYVFLGKDGPDAGVAPETGLVIRNVRIYDLQ